LAPVHSCTYDPGRREIRGLVRRRTLFRANPPQPKDTPLLERFVGGHQDLIRFRTIEVLRWPDPAETLGGPFPGLSPLSPTNEQIRGDDDPWLQWVREQLAQGA